MTGYTVHTGSSEKFSSGWDQIFSGKKTARKSETKEENTPAAVKSGGPKKAAKKKA